jgi:hypothetical protein
MNWHQVYNLNIKEFLNIICYLIDKSQEESRKIDE